MILILKIALMNLSKPIFFFKFFFSEIYFLFSNNIKLFFKKKKSNEEKDDIVRWDYGSCSIECQQKQDPEKAQSYDWVSDLKVFFFVFFFLKFFF